MKIIAAAVVVILAVVGVLIAGAWRSPIVLITRPDPNGFDQALVKRGADLAAAGNCNTCHTLPDGRPYAGGLGLPTPFGTLYSTNLTPDAQTGIGSWSEEAFRRAMREGVSRDGNHLYPVFPYDHFTLLSDDDVGAGYAFFLSREPVLATPPADDVSFPLNVRLVRAGWKLLYFRPGPYKPDHAQSAAWNRGAYLVEGLAHCGACHTPRNSYGAETKDPFAGDEAEGWTAYAFNQASPAPVPWNAEALGTYLRRGWHAEHGVARGPMAAVVNNLAAIPEDDFKAMTTYLADFLETPSTERRRAAEALLERAGPHRQTEPPSDEMQTVGRSSGTTGEEPGAEIYRSACADCHDGVRPLPF